MGFRVVGDNISVNIPTHNENEMFVETFLKNRKKNNLTYFNIPY